MKVKVKLEKCSDIVIDTNKILSIYQRNDPLYSGMYVIEYLNEDGIIKKISVHPSTFKSIKIKRWTNDLLIYFFSNNAFMVFR